ncbi:hypothetical protein [Haploplasma axanthum]|uniref:Uncharacterized protein n=1 Tax=Haploplasma axanthum TaxID=29552 RepID=A0A449BDD1_HAPAX|nr:hypothetical protein [Haploplasma axanthum]VEU80427.1 Uncharacterised protein [Haploplasma axanthum]
MKKIAVLESSYKINYFEKGDIFPKLKKIYSDEYDLVRITENNIDDFFSSNNNNILKYDAIIINIIEESIIEKLVKSKEEIEKFINLGKGVFISASLSSMYEKNFLPDKYQYQVVDTKNQDEFVFNSKSSYDANKYILNHPNKLDDSLKEKIGLKSRLIPASPAYFFRIIGIQSIFLMSSIPVNNEKVLVTSISLEDLVETEKILDNILSYITCGIPRIAFVKKDGEEDSGFNYLNDETEALNLKSKTYSNKNEMLKSKLKEYHDVYIFSKEYLEEEILDIFIKWKNIKNVKFFYYKKISKDLFLTEITNQKMIENQRMDVYSLVLYTYKIGYWNNSFYETISIVEALVELELEFDQFINSIFDEVDKYYKNGSYENKIIETCGLLKLESLILKKYENERIKGKREETKKWLISQFEKASFYQKKNIIKTFISYDDINIIIEMFYDNNKEKFTNYIEKNSIKENIEDLFELVIIDDLKLYLKLIKLSDGKRDDLVDLSKKYLKVLLDKQDEYGIWNDDLNKTAQIIDSLYEMDIELLGKKLKNQINEDISKSITVLKKSYYIDRYGKDLSLSVNAIKALRHYYIRLNENAIDIVYTEADSLLKFKTIDFLTKSLEEIIEVNAKDKKKLRNLEIIESKYYKNKVRLNTIGSLTSILFLLLISYYIFLALENIEVFKKIMSQSLMWVPIAIGMLVTPTVAFISKKLVGKQLKKEEEPENK